MKNTSMPIVNAPVPSPVIAEDPPVPLPEESLRVGDKVFICYRGSPQLYPAWVTNMREQGGRGQHRLTFTMLWDKGTGVALVHDPVHQSVRRNNPRESWWTLPEEAESL